MLIESPNNAEQTPEGETSENQARRDFLKKAGRFAAVTTPAITLLLGTSLSSKAMASSSGSGSHRGKKWGWRKHYRRWYRRRH
jgi:hypothetical protein